MNIKYNAEDYVGQKFGHLTLISAEKVQKQKGIFWYKCKCDCGNECYRKLTDLILCRAKTCSVNCKFHGRSEKNKKQKSRESIAKEQPKKKIKFVELDRESFQIIPYQVKYGCISITPCPNRLSPKPLVGGMDCQKCSSFNGIDRYKKEVACNKLRNLKYGNK